LQNVLNEAEQYGGGKIQCGGSNRIPGEITDVNEDQKDRVWLGLKMNLFLMRGHSPEKVIMSSRDELERYGGAFLRPIWD